MNDFWGIRRIASAAESRSDQYAGMASRHLSSKQKEVLERLVGDEVVTRRSHPELAATVYALRNRGLVTTEKRKNGDWQVTLTDEGRSAAATGWVPSHMPVPRGRAYSVESPAKARSTASSPDAAGKRTVRVATSPAARHVDHARVAIQATRDSLKGPTDEKGLLHSSGEGSVPVSVGRASISRTMALLKSIFQAVRDAGGEVELEPRRSPYDRRRDALRTILVFDGQRYGFTVVEELDRTAHEPTKSEQAQKDRYSWTRIPEWDYNPSGRVCIRLEDSFDRSRTARGRFADGKTALAEDKVAEPVGTTPLNGFPDAWQPEGLTRVNGDVRILALQVLEGINVSSGRKTSLSASNVEAHDPSVAEGHDAFGDIARPRGSSHGSEQRADSNVMPCGGRRSLTFPEARELRLDDLIQRQAGRSMQFGCEAHLGIDHSIGGKIFGGFGGHSKQR